MNNFELVPIQKSLGGACPEIIRTIENNSILKTKHFNFTFNYDNYFF